MKMEGYLALGKDFSRIEGSLSLPNRFAKQLNLI